MMMNRTFNRRHSPNRRKTRVPARLRFEGGVLEIVIRNVSYEGMGLQVPCPLDPGTPVTIEAAGARIPAIIHWHRSGHAGAHLLDRLDGAVLIALETADDEFAAFR